MPRKIILIPVILLAFVGIVFASMGLFPDTGSFPRFPGGPGTLSGVLSMFRSDGTANNTNMLSGVTASGYLQNNFCDSSSLTNNVWVGVDADGRAICGNTAGLLTVAPIGRLSEFHGTVTVFKSGATGYVPATLNMDLHEGDLIHSDPNGTGTIAFLADASLLRFFVDTDLELRYGLLGGNTVAEAILGSGALWGRILTSTGVNIGGGGVVTGVRGTSVYITKVGNQFTLNLVNSTSSANEVNQLTTTQTTLSNGAKGFINTAIASMISGGSSGPVSSSSTIIGSGTTVSYTAGATSVTALVQNPALLLSVNQWIRENTIADIEYMSNLLSGTLDPVLITKLNAELDTTVMSGNLLVAEAFLTGGALNNPADVASGAVLLDEENQTDNDENQTEVNKNKAKRQQCKKSGFTYFRGLGNCFGSWKDLAITNFGINLNLHGKKAKWNFTASGASNNIIATSTGYLEYSGSLVDLQGKTIRIEYTGTPPSSKNIFSDGASSYVKATASSWNFNGVGDFSYSNLPPKYVSFKILSNPIRFIIGNNSSFNAGLSGATITKVSIQ